MGTAEASPFHDGEIEIQKLVGVREQIEAQGRKYIRTYMPDQHREFFSSLPFVMVGGVDPSTERPWASLFVGQPGFMSSTSPTRLTIRPAEQQLAGDPIAACIQVDQPLGFLGIELKTRRRNRLNGKIISTEGGAIEVGIHQSFGNCPQYIQAREVYALDGARPAPAASDAIRDTFAQSTHDTVQGPLNQRAKDIVDAADTLFIASSSMFADGPRWGADVSHRGGRPGFVRTEEIEDAASPESGSHTRISFPDFLGNFQFQTLGNILRDPRCGLLFWDFATGDILQMTGKGETVWTGEEIKVFTGAQRVVRFVVEEWILREGALALFLHVDPSVQWSPTLTTTGIWKEALEALEAQREKTRFRAFEVYQVVKESSTITSFYLRPQDKSQALVVYEAGQFLPIRVMVPCTASGPTACVDCPADGTPTSTHKPHTLRFYSLSDRPTGQYYRISVRRHTQGKMSRFLHDVMLPGAFIEAQAPRGSFTLKQKEINKPAVFLSAGVGCTPFVAMLQHHLGPIARTKDHRPMFYIHGSRNGAEHAFKEELQQLQRLHGNLKVYTCYSKPLATDRRGDNFDHEGRVDIDTVQTFLATQNIEIAQADYYLCGPEPFIDEIYVGLRRAGAPKGSVMYEHFESNWSAKGKKDVIREFELALRSQLRASASASTSTAAAGANDVTIHFKRSGRSVVWRGGGGEDAPTSLLEAAEQEGLMPPYSCRAGVCGTCALPVLEGEVEYRQDPFAEMLPGHALMCCAVPRKGQEGQRIVIDF